MSVTAKRLNNSLDISTEKRTITPRQSRRSLTCRCLLTMALMLGSMAATIPVWAQTCQIEDPAILAAKNNYLYLYFPTTADSTFPAYATRRNPADCEPCGCIRCQRADFRHRHDRAVDRRDQESGGRRLLRV